jgi:hypothetical protein
MGSAEMDLTGLPFLLVLIAAAATLVAVTMLVWNRWSRWWAYPMRVVCLLSVMVAGAVLAAAVVNRTYGFYTSLDDLLGRVPVQGTVAGLVPARVAENAKGRVIRVRLDGARSGVSRGALVYLPAAYFQKSQVGRRFPVLELFHGFPGSPGNWTRQLHLAQVLDAEIAAGRIPAVIAVVPTDDDGGLDSECVNAVQGEQDETYLAVDVPADIRRDFRALDTPRGWATLGYSTGGFCAVNIALHHPDRYAAAASLSGYYSAIVDDATGDLYKGNAAARRWNSPNGWSPTGPSPYPCISSPAVATSRRCEPCSSCVRQPESGCRSLPSPCPPAATISMSGTPPAWPPSNGSVPTCRRR